MIPWNTSGLPELFGELVRLEIELWDAVDARLLADHGLTLGRLLPMQVLARRPGCRVQDIAEELAITVGGARKVVDRIAAAGHCVRRPNPGDRRSSLIELTPAGERVLAASTASYTGELDRRLGGALGRAEVHDLTATLSRLRKAVAA